LTWFVGPTKAKAYLKSGEKVVEEDVVVEPAKISSAVQEEPVLNQLNRFQSSNSVYRRRLDERALFGYYSIYHYDYICLLSFFNCSCRERKRNTKTMRQVFKAIEWCGHSLYLLFGAKSPQL